jgi:pantothenate kinase
MIFSCFASKRETKLIEIKNRIKNFEQLTPNVIQEIKNMGSHDKMEIITTYNSTMKMLTELLYTDFKLKIDHLR